MHNVLITGASGFVGQHLLEDIDPSQFKIKIITRHPEKKMRVQIPGIEILKADLNDHESLKRAFKGIDILVNTAAEVRNADKLAETNIEGTKNLIKAVVENKIPKVIHLSSVGVVGMQFSNEPVIVDEETVCHPKNEYERTKLESERLLIEASKHHGFQLIILRPTNVFGEYHPFNALLNMIQYINSEKPMLNTSKAMVNYVYVKDLTAVINRLLYDQHSKGILNVGGSDSLKHFSGSISEILNIKTKQITVPQFLINFMKNLKVDKFNAISNTVRYSDDKLRMFFKYPYDLQNGLKRTIYFYKEKGLIK